MDVTVLALPVIRLKKERDKSARARNPWLFSGAFAALPELEPGSLCRIEDAAGAFVAVGPRECQRNKIPRIRALKRSSRYFCDMCPVVRLQSVRDPFTGFPLPLIYFHAIRGPACC